MKDRKYYIDNLRWLWIAMLIPFHAAMAWNNWEGNYIKLGESKILSSLVIFISPWYMPLLFVIAGMSTKYALERRSLGQYAKERVHKLLIPFLAGTLTVVAVMTYYADKLNNGYEGSFFEHYGVFLTKITDLTGYDGRFSPAHLWFLLFLFIISLLAIGIIALQKKFLPKLSFANTKAIVIPFLVVIPIALTQVLNFGVGKSVGSCLGMFLLGYYILTEEEVLKKLSKYAWIFLVIMIIVDGVTDYLFVWRQMRTGVLFVLFYDLEAWLGVIGFLGLARMKFNQNNAFTRYMASRSFLIYIFHFMWLVILQYYLSKATESIVLIYLISVVGAFMFTFLTCEVVNRIPGVRYLFGAKKK